MIYSLQITDTKTGVSPIYEVHSWEKAQEIIDATKKLTDDEFTFQVFGRVAERPKN
jgi:hypothetical protein